MGVRSLKKSITYKYGKLINSSIENRKKDNHYKTICTIHNKWARKGVYVEAYAEIAKQKITNMKTNKGALELIIDATNIINKSGIVCVGYGSECKKKKFTKLTGLSDTNASIVAIDGHNTKSKEITFKNNDKKLKINTLEHDTKGKIPQKIYSPFHGKGDYYLGQQCYYKLGQKCYYKLGQKYQTHII